MGGESNIKYLVDNGVHIWDSNAFDHNIGGLVKEGIFPESVRDRYSPDWHKAKEDYAKMLKDDPEFAERWGDVGPLYGKQWRHWRYEDDNGDLKELDQFEQFIDVLTKRPTSKRNVITAWNPGENLSVSQPPCHLLIQSSGNLEGQMDLLMFQRSSDMFLGVPFNIASYAMLMQIVAQQAGLEPRRFVHSFGDTHFYCGDGERSEWYRENLGRLKRVIKRAKTPEDYLNARDWITVESPEEREGTTGQDHVTAILEQLSRTPREIPRLEIANKPFNELTINDFTLTGYRPHTPIRRTMAV
tara:strand:- start:646 stop:1545 length:900 start_codon:yes stop_codon:yes gene_type:complete